MKRLARTLRSGKCFLYVLQDPIDNTVRYIGITYSPKTRFSQHLCCGERSEWVDLLKMVNQKPIMKIIKVVDAGSSREIERIAIKKAISLGWPLMNHEHVFPKGYFNRTKSFQSAYSSIREELLRFC